MSCRPARYLSSRTHSQISKRCLATAPWVSSSITNGHYVLKIYVDPKRLCSENNTMKEAQNKLTVNATAGIVAAALAAASCVFIFHEPLISRFSEIRPIPWFLTERETEALVDQSTWTNLNKVEPGTNDRDYLSSLIVVQSYVRILLFVHQRKTQKTVAQGPSKSHRITNVDGYVLYFQSNAHAQVNRPRNRGFPWASKLQWGYRNHAWDGAGCERVF